ncbi:MAG: TIGR04222 domain-containing membrane protein [Planctomycetia bacterium]|nr:TIGR04222 domain-containing membrane protein [Planctomycetia bacterium]
MRPEHADLFARIMAFDIDDGETALPFAARLAREQGWSRTFADRVITEYKRYVFLAVTSGITVCPSEDVDAAWHLHLTYTRSYWKRFCGEVLNRPLHHEPTKGGPAEAEKHLKMYAETLSAYRQAFGESPPADIWPSAKERFGEDIRHRVVNTGRNWVIPKPPVKRVAQFALAFVLIALFVPGCNGGMNPFALQKTDFLYVLLPALLGAAFFGRVIRNVMRTPNPQPEDDEIELNWEQSAYMAGGAGRLTSAAIARLVERALAKVADDNKTLARAMPIPATDVSAVEKAVLQSLPVSNDVTSLKPVETAVEAAFATEAEKLAEAGITLSTARQAGIGCAAIVPVALVLLCLALPRLIMGLNAGNPVKYLIIASIFGGMVASVIAIVGAIRLTNRGTALLERQKERHGGLKAGSRWEPQADAGMAVALFGTAVLAGTSIALLQSWYPRQTSEGSSGGCGSGCGSGCGGGGGCGGGCGGGD